ncbi:MAG: selenocysteine-specific translation elongation factor [Rhodocyclaceae bacterium]|nr:selenocysteine-specific translation elongation factor [Rhodocyclaceae bacterium]
MIIGTAGHIDHGKTTLVKALTGVNTDRLPEEKRRGITLDLGYAYMPLDAGEPESPIMGFIDVPGHERLIHNMLAGATGIDFVLLVIAATDGPMPQTREHLGLLNLLGIKHGAVAITMSDLVTPERLVAAHDEVRDLLKDSFLGRYPIFPLSSVTGDGVSALRSHLLAIASRHQERLPEGRFRLAIDRCFSLSGAGTVVTGTAHSGKIGVGDTAMIVPSGQSGPIKARIRSLHVQDRVAASGQVGQRCALALVGDFERQDLKRGMWLVDPALALSITRFHAELSVPRDQVSLLHWQAVHLHLGTSDIPARVALLEGTSLAPGECALAEIVLEHPTFCVHGDHFVLRDASAQRTVAGGRVLDIFPPSRHKRAAARLELLNAMRDEDPSHVLEIQTARAPAGIDLHRFAINWNLTDHDAECLWHQANLRVIKTADEQIGFSVDAWEALALRLTGALASEHERAPEMSGVERERLRRMTLATLSRSAFDTLVADLLAKGVIAQTRSWLHLAGHIAQMSESDRDLFNALKVHLNASPYNPPRVRDVSGMSGLPEEVVRQLFRRIARAGELYLVAHDHYFSANAVAELAEKVRELSDANHGVRAASLRDVIGGGRKVAIQILEFFDRIGYTRRVRDEHQLRREGSLYQWELSNCSTQVLEASS